MQDSPTDERNLFARPGPVAACFAGAGLLDGLLSLLNGAPEGFGAALAVLLITLGFWLLLGFACWAGLGLLALLVGPQVLSDGFVRARIWLNEARDEPDPERDRALLATAMAWLVGAGLWLLLGAGVLAYLIATRNGPWLISAASLVVHLLLLPIGVVAGLAARRGSLREPTRGLRPVL